MAMERIDLLDRSNKLSTLQLLENSNWTNDLTHLQQEELATFFQPYSAAPGTIIFMEGEPIYFFCLLCEGDVDVIKENSSGQLKKLKSFGPGKVIGEMAFFDNGPSSATIVVKSKSVLLIMNHQSFDELCSHLPFVAIKMMNQFILTLSSRLRETSGKLIDLI
jgi:CRP/FNR family transcriptional regulator, cyclic AMP receptor protein